ncbi:hypothetical protein RSOL_443190 [Rhizoctonia solani AG-3 Rhs1AP]|uniref:Uncharacterized protein n=2 Tax=Rhizoctonia solani AG-3 TaxID=1086053 RepID=A0A074T196_9AGAM|nr:hypothetical protein RSOL_443190 [Rhizoctonia solani AG-3 Rhs1AP]KEP55762.1 hypothetical protein V565_000150 [Rhizoctonia solani 123E]
MVRAELETVSRSRFRSSSCALGSNASQVEARLEPLLRYRMSRGTQKSSLKTQNVIFPEKALYMNIVSPSSLLDRLPNSKGLNASRRRSLPPQDAPQLGADR